MIGIWNDYANIFLILIGVVTLLAFGLPLTFVPMRWARLFRWDVSQPTQLAVFVGRSLGVLLSIIAIFAFVVISDTAAMPFYFNLVLSIFVGMFLLHVYGALRKAQPITETVEIALWVVLTLVTLGFYPA